MKLLEITRTSLIDLDLMLRICWRLMRRYHLSGVFEKKLNEDDDVSLGLSVSAFPE